VAGREFIGRCAREDKAAEEEAEVDIVESVLCRSCVARKGAMDCDGNVATDRAEEMDERRS